VVAVLIYKVRSRRPRELIGRQAMSFGPAGDRTSRL